MSSKAELRRFIETTSVKGVGRAYRSPITLLRIIWSVSVCLFLLLAGYQSYILIYEYTTWPTVTHIEQSFFDSFQGVDPMYKSPDLTICNLNPLNSNRSNLNITNISSFIDLVQESAVCHGCPYAANGISLQDVLLTTAGYFQHIGEHNARTLGHVWPELVASCQMEVFDGFASVWKPCWLFADITQNTDPQMFNCYTLKVNTSSRLFVAGYSIIFHLDNFDVEGNFPMSHYMFPKSFGAAVLPHMRGTKPMVKRDAIFISPGEHTDIKLKIQHTHRLEPPLGDCQVIKYLPHNNNWTYTVKSCISDCLEHQVIQNCNCKDASMMNVLVEFFPDLPYCLQFESDLNITLQRYECAQQIRTTLYQYCNDNCPPVCKEIQYGWETSHSLWPIQRWPEDFYYSYIENTVYEERYRSLNNTEDYTTAIGFNFASVQVYISDFNIVNFEEVQKITFVSLVSSVGAAMNLWAGITVVLLIEIAEVILRICLNREAKTTSEANDPEKTEPNRAQNIQINSTKL